MRSLFQPFLNFIQNNYVGIIIIIILACFFIVAFYVSTSSLKKLKTSIFQSYPFDVFFPQGGTWSVGYFLVAILLVGLLIYLLVKGEFYLGPA